MSRSLGTKVLFGLVVIVPCLWFQSCTLLVSLQNRFQSAWEHDQWLGDDGRVHRIPLWFPYEIDWMGDSAPCLIKVEGTEMVGDDGTVDGSRSSVVSPVVDFQVGTNVICGVCEKPADTRERARQDTARKLCYFLFATNLNEAVYFENEQDFLRQCASYGIDGRSRKNFEANVEAFVNRPDQQYTIENVKEHFKRHPLKKSERNFVIAVLTVPLLVWYLLVRFFWSGLCRKRLECL